MDPVAPAVPPSILNRRNRSGPTAFPTGNCRRGRSPGPPASRGAAGRQLCLCASVGVLGHDQGQSVDQTLVALRAADLGVGQVPLREVGVLHAVQDRVTLLYE